MKNADRDQAKKRLVLTLKRLARCCKPRVSIWPGTLWPDREFLQLLENHVMLLIATERKKQPSPAWKAFLLLNRRVPSLLLVSHVNNLVKRARERLEEVGESPLSKLERQVERGDEHARKLLRDIEAIREGQGAPTKIDWSQHERPLAQFSRTRSVEPAYGRSAPVEFRCYARALELIVDDHRRKPLRDKSLPLIEWTARIGHPEAKNLCAFDDVAAWIAEQYEGVWQGKSAFQKRERGNERVRRHREWHRGKWRKSLRETITRAHARAWSCLKVRLAGSLIHDHRHSAPPVRRTLRLTGPRQNRCAPIKTAPLTSLLRMQLARLTLS